MDENPKKLAVIIGAGPAGLTCAYELLKQTDYQVIIIEKNSYVGGLSASIEFDGYRLDIGGHRFYSKSDRVLDWWFQFMKAEDSSAKIYYQGESRDIKSDITRDTDNIFLLRTRKSRIIFKNAFFDYPLKISLNLFKSLGLNESIKMGISYVIAKLFPKKSVNSLEDFFISRFGKRLYQQFFKSYTEKVWGISCKEISAEWGAQRIKTLSLSRALVDSISNLLGLKSKDLKQKSSETSLIERFLYPKYGPGQMWELVASEIEKLGGKIYFNSSVAELKIENSEVKSLILKTADKSQEIKPDLLVSSIAISDLFKLSVNPIPTEIKEVATSLSYRNFISLGIVFENQELKSFKDTWIYIQTPGILLGRLQFFHNWSPYLLADQTKVFLGLEYFCGDQDAFWKAKDTEVLTQGISDLKALGLVKDINVLNYKVVHAPKAYPAYFGSYAKFSIVREYLDSVQNMYCVGRNGMHRYNNQDHSMLSSLLLVDGIKAGSVNRAELWDINTEQEHN